MQKKTSWINRSLRQIMWWFEFTMIVIAYVAAASQLAGKGLDCLVIMLFIWLLIYMAGKSWFYISDINK